MWTLAGCSSATLGAASTILKLIITSLWTDPGGPVYTLARRPDGHDARSPNVALCSRPFGPQCMSKWRLDSARFMSGSLWSAASLQRQGKAAHYNVKSGTRRSSGRFQFYQNSPYKTSVDAGFAAQDVSGSACVCVYWCTLVFH